MIIYRKGNGPNWTFVDENGKPISKMAHKYVSGLVIPPAYKNVRIYYEATTPKILFDGIDSAGRLQQIYSIEHTQQSNDRKFKALIKFGKMLPKIYAEINDNIKKTTSRPGKEQVISIILRIINICGFRIGHTKYEKLYGSHGMITLKRKHMKINKDGHIEVEFVGKKGVINTCTITDTLVLPALVNIMNNKKANDYIFTYGESLIKAIEVNNWLKRYDIEFTSKFFRTYDTNILLLEHLNKLSKDPAGITINQRKKYIVEALKYVSDCINNTPAICKKSYANIDIINMYINEPTKFKSAFLVGTGVDKMRRNFVKFLETNDKKNI